MEPHLERRSSDSASRTPGVASAPVGPDAFKQLLIRHGQRYVKDGKPFCLGAIEILEYEHVKRLTGQALADDLDQLGRLVLKHQLRVEDRVCAISPCSFLVLLPDTSIENAKKVLERVLHKLSSSHRKRGSTKNRASGIYQVASAVPSSADQLGAPAIDAQVTEFHLEALLEVVGYRIDLNGSIVKSVQGSQGETNRMFSGSHDLWLSRYEPGSQWAPESVEGCFVVTSVLAKDTWSADKTVVLRVIRCTDDSWQLGGERCDELLKRLRVLQSIEHAGLSRLQDFHVNAKNLRNPLTIYLVESLPTGSPLAQNSSMTPLEAVELIIQLANLGIFFLSLVPPISPVCFESTHIWRTDSFVLTDYQIPFILPSVLDDSSPSRTSKPKTEVSLRSLGKLADGLKRTSPDHDRVLGSLADGLLAQPMPEMLNSMFKVKAEAQRALPKAMAP